MSTRVTTAAVMAFLLGSLPAAAIMATVPQPAVSV